jgi:hypothetical protein
MRVEKEKASIIARLSRYGSKNQWWSCGFIDL